MGPGSQFAQISQGHSETDGAMAAHIQNPDIIEKNHACDGLRVIRLAKEAANPDIASPRFVHYCCAEGIVLVSKGFTALGKAPSAQIRAAVDYQASGLPTCMGVDDPDPVK
jgi:hypothetical protein